MYLQVNVYEPHGDHKQKTYNREKNKKENVTSILLSKIIKSQRKRLKEDQRRTKQQKTNNKMTASKNLSIISLNVNGLNASIKRYRVADWVKKTRPIYILLTRDSFQS